MLLSHEEKHSLDILLAWNFLLNLCIWTIKDYHSTQIRENAQYCWILFWFAIYLMAYFVSRNSTNSTGRAEGRILVEYDTYDGGP
jgi:hypothetical protein